MTCKKEDAPPIEIPSEVRIGPEFIEIEFLEDLWSTDGTSQKLDGAYNNAGAFIALEKNLAAESAWHTLFHEIAHGAFFQFFHMWEGTGEGQVGEEECDKLASFLFSFLRDNKALVDAFYAYDCHRGTTEKDAEPVEAKDGTPPFEGEIEGFGADKDGLDGGESADGGWEHSTDNVIDISESKDGGVVYTIKA